MGRVASSGAAIACAVGGLVLLSTSCGSSDDETGSGTDPDPEVSIEDLATRYAEAYCAAAKSCMGAAWEVYGPENDLEECVTLYTRSFGDSVISLLEGLVSAGKVAYDGKKAHSCIETVKSGGCTYLGPRQAEVCREALLGLTARGADCASDLECGSDDYCNNDASCPGTCMARGVAGAACNRDRACAPETTCEIDACQGVLPSGSACGTGVSGVCDAGAVCLATDPNDPEGPATCLLLSSLFANEQGQGCNQIDLCKPPFVCVLTFDPVTSTLTGTCEEPATSGASCGLTFPDACPPGEACAGIDLDSSPPVLTGTCESAPAVGAACTESGLPGGSVCAPYARCVGGTCAAMERLGGTCTDGAACYSSACEGGTCTRANVCE